MYIDVKVKPFCNSNSVFFLCFFAIVLLICVVKRYTQWDQNIPRYKNYISVLFKQITLEDIHNKIWKQIQYLQEERREEKRSEERPVYNVPSCFWRT